MPPFSGEVVVIASADAAMTTVKDFVVDAGLAALSVTCAVKVKLPAAAGVPPSTPALLNVRPVGTVPLLTLHAYGVVPPVATSVCE